MILETNLDNYELTEEVKQNLFEGGDILKVKDNRTFHALINSQDKEATLWFMSQILERPMNEIKKIIKIENSELRPLNHYDKGRIVDFIVSVGDDVVIVEMNNNAGRDYTRNLYYTFHALLNKVEIGEKYNVRHGILVNLNWFENKELQNMPGITEVNYPYPIIGMEEKDSIIKVKNINLCFYDKKRYNGVVMKGFVWKLFTINKVSDIQDVSKNVKELSHYCKEIERLSKDKEYCMNVWSERLEKNLSNLSAYNDGKEDGKEEGIAIGKQEGIVIGKQEGIVIGETNQKKDTVIMMYKKRIPIDTIAECVNLSKEEVEKIICSLNEK